MAAILHHPHLSVQPNPSGQLTTDYRISQMGKGACLYPFHPLNP